MAVPIPPDVDLVLDDREHLGTRARQADAELVEPDDEGECEVCGSSPIVPITGMCGPCTFGEAETIDGNW